MDAPTPLQDDLVTRARDGDRDALADLIHATSGPLRVFLAGFCRHEEDIEDLMQQIYLKTWRGLPSLKDAHRFPAWFWRIARFSAIDHTRVRRRDQEEGPSMTIDDIDEPVTQEANVVHDLRRRSLTKEVQHCLDALPESARRLLELRYHDDLSYGQIADRLGLSAVQVKARLARARSKLRPRLGKLVEEWERLRHELS